MNVNKLSEQVEQVLIGSILGDGRLSKNKGIGTNPRFYEGHSIKQKDYLLWKKLMLSKIFNMKDYYKKEESIFIYSNTSPLLIKYYNSFYPFGKKIFSIDMLNKLQPLGLAIWYMDDGSFHQGGSSEIAFNKKNINPEILKEWFKETFGINSWIREEKDGDGVRILFKREETKKLFRIIHLFIHSTMRYKIKKTKEDILIIKRKGRDYRQRPEIITHKKEYMKKYYQKKYKDNPEFELKRKEYDKRRYQKKYKDNPEFKLKKKEYYQKNKEEILARGRKKYRERRNDTEKSRIL